MNQKKINSTLDILFITTNDLQGLTYELRTMDAKENEQYFVDCLENIENIIDLLKKYHKALKSAYKEKK